MIPAEELKRIAAHAASTYPAECCGVLLAGASGALRFLAIDNIAGTTEGAQTSARSGRDGYVMHPKQLLKALQQADEEGGQLWGIVHSHPDVGAYFSSEDRHMALAGGNEPLWPGVQYLVVSVRAGRVDGARIYRWEASIGDFVETEVTGITSI